MQLRCSNGILFGEVNEDILEVKCKSGRCGKRPGVVVLHQFNLITGEVTTKKFKEPKGVRDDALNHPTAVRSA